MTHQHRPPREERASNDRSELAAPQAGAEGSDARWRTLIEGLDAVIWEARAGSLDFSYVSPRGVALLGYSMEEWLGQDFWSGRLIHPDDRDWVVRYCVEETTAGRDHDFVYRVLAAGGEVIVAQAGGTVRMLSAPRAGTAVTVYLPVVGDGSRTEERGDHREPKEGCTLLLVEDEETVRSALRRMLQRQGHRVLEAANGAEAIEIWQRHRADIDVLATDLVMPVMGGRALIEHVRRQHATLPVLIMSGYAEEARELGESLPGSRVLAKPFTAEALARRLHELLQPA